MTASRSTSPSTPASISQGGYLGSTLRIGSGGSRCPATSGRPASSKNFRIQLPAALVRLGMLTSRLPTGRSAGSGARRSSQSRSRAGSRPGGAAGTKAGAAVRAADPGGVVAAAGRAGSAGGGGGADSAGSSTSRFAGSQEVATEGGAAAGRSGATRGPMATGAVACPRGGGFGPGFSERAMSAGAGAAFPSSTGNAPEVPVVALAARRAWGAATAGGGGATAASGSRAPCGAATRSGGGQYGEFGLRPGNDVLRRRHPARRLRRCSGLDERLPAIGRSRRREPDHCVRVKGAEIRRRPRRRRRPQPRWRAVPVDGHGFANKDQMALYGRRARLQKHGQNQGQMRQQRGRHSRYRSPGLCRSQRTSRATGTRRQQQDTQVGQ